ncbi:DUF1493 family protein [Patescibacteria group bacterium]|nr:DUF1493 family protein [Patescibacteria group bacterium]MCL5409951.1 DUF1493 family protein [Patescibacteria group bacterium]
MADQKQIIEAIAQALTLPESDIDLDSSLQDDLGLNPVEIADLLGSLSKEFKIFFEQSDVTGLKTVGDLVVLIEDKLLE